MELFCESFDSYNGTSATIGLSARWLNTNGSQNSTNLTTGRYGGQGLSIENNSGAGGHSGYSCALGFTTNDFAVSYGCKVTSPGGSACQLSLGNETVRHVGLRWNADLSLSVVVGSTTTGAGTEIWRSLAGIIAIGTWHTMRFRGNIHASAGEIEVMLDNDVLVTLTAQDTWVSGTVDVSRVYINSHNGTGVVLDDIVICDDSSAHLPELRIQALAPNADGAHLDLTPSTGSTHYGVVDEGIVAIADYLSGTTIGHYDLLGVADLSTVPGNILGVQIVGFANKTAAASRAWNLGIVSGGTTDDGPDLSLSSDIQFRSRMEQVDPDTGVTWTQSGVNALQIKPTVAV